MATIQELREASCKQLRANPKLNLIQVISEDKHNIETEILKALAKGSGAVIVVSTGGGDSLGKALIPPQAVMELVVECAETPAINRSNSGSNKPAVDMAVIVAKALHLFQWTPSNPLVFQRIVADEGGSTIIYRVIFKTAVVLDDTAL